MPRKYISKRNRTENERLYEADRLEKNRKPGRPPKDGMATIEEQKPRFDPQSHKASRHYHGNFEL